jgi:hypothetical protein
MSNDQRAICVSYGTEFVPPLEDSRLGVALNVRAGLVPINGLRHPPTPDTNGWYVWAGEQFEARDDFFLPLHVSHIDSWHRGISKFLALPPGWRFLFANGYEDVWFDEALLNV